MTMRHVVLLRFKADVPAPDIANIERAFSALRSQVETVRDLEWGTDVSPEGLSKSFTHCFFISFADAAGRDIYLTHPAHMAFVALLRPTLDDVLVVDYESRT